MANTKKTPATKPAAPSKKPTAAAQKPAAKPAAKKPAAKPTAAQKPAVKPVAAPAPVVKPAAEQPKAKDVSPVRVLFATAEAFPFAGTGGLGEVAGSLPKALNTLGVDARVIMPLYGTMPQKFRDRLEYITKTNVLVGWRNQYCGLLRLVNDGVTTYFIDNEYYFKRDRIYGMPDDGERWAFFCRAVLEVLPLLDFKPNIIHTNDHATAMIPVYYATEYYNRYGYGGIKNVFTVHNLEYQGCYPSFILGDVFGIDERNRGFVDFNWQINCVKGAIETADMVSTVSPTYAREILTPERSCGLSGILGRNRQKVCGILNGINVDEYNPEKSPAICKNFTAADMSGKAECKRAIKSECGFEMGDRPIVAVISRLAGHKGLDLVKGLLERGYSGFDNADLIVLGTGENYLEEFFSRYAGWHGNACAFITYNKDLAQRIYAGSDIFLMPSGAEPCGLSQMMACRYGTVPIVRRTGGLADSIRDIRASGDGNGFLFDDYTIEALDGTLRAAIDMYNGDKAGWGRLMHNAMTCDFSWNKSALDYEAMYKRLLGL